MPSAIEDKIVDETLDQIIGGGEGDTCSHVFDSKGEAVKRELLLRLRRQQLEFLHEGAVVAALQPHRHAFPVPVGRRSYRSVSQPKRCSRTISG